MSELSPGARALLDAARGADGPGVADKARVRAALAAQLGGPPGSSPSPSSSSGGGGGPGTVMHATSAGTSSGIWAVTAKVLAGAALLGGLGAGGYLLLSTRTEPVAAPAARLEALPPTLAPPAEPPPMQLEPKPQMQPQMQAQPGEPQPQPPTQSEADRRATPEATPDVTPAPRRRRSRPVPAAEPVLIAENAGPATQPIAISAGPDQEPAADPIALLREEQALIARAKRILKDGDAAGAMGFLREHGKRFAAGMLVEERSALRVMALCASGGTTAGRRERADFLARWPSSPHAAGVRSACDPSR